MRLDSPFGCVVLPASAQNQSTYHYTFDFPSAPVGLLAGRAVHQETMRGSATITSGHLSKAALLPQLLLEQREELAATCPGFRITSEEVWPHPHFNSVPQLEFEFAAGSILVRQRQCYFAWPGATRFTCVALAAEKSAFNGGTATLVAVFESFTLA